MNRLRLEFATTVFLAEMRRQWAILHPGEPCPVKNFSDYPPDQLSALMAAVGKSSNMGGPAGDKLFEAWHRKRHTAEREAAEATE